MRTVVGKWVRPWPGEGLIAEIIAVSGDWLICRAPGNLELRMPLTAVGTLYRSEHACRSSYRTVPARWAAA